MRKILKLLARRYRKIRGYLVIIKLKIMGCDVDWSAVIDPSAVIQPSGGSIRIGPRTSIDHGAILRGMGGVIKIGADCSVNAYSFLSGFGGIAIADSVMVASHVSIYASNHLTTDLELLMQTQGLSAKGIVIERNVWVGTGVRILDGVTVGEGAVLAAGAVVTKSVPPLSISGGVPAKIIGNRVPI